MPPNEFCEEGNGPTDTDSSTPRDTQEESSQGEALNGQARLAGNAEARWRALTSYPDFCQVGDKIVGFDSEATLGNPVNYSPNVVTAGQRTYRVGDLCQGTEGNDGSGVGSGTSQGSGHVLFLTGQDNVKANGQPVVHDGSECTINCNAAGVGGAKGYVHTNTEAVNSQPEESSEPLTVAEQLQQEAQANLERVGELREALNDNPTGKTAAENEALYAQAQQLVSETQAQQEALMEAHRAGIFRDNELVESSTWVDEAANRAFDQLENAERQTQYTSDVGRGTRQVGDFAAEMLLTPYGLAKDTWEFGKQVVSGHYMAATGVALVALVSVIPGVRWFRRSKSVDDIPKNGGGNRSETPGDNEGLRVEENSGRVEENVVPNSEATATLTEETSTVFRVQGGAPPHASWNHIQIDANGNPLINRTTLNVSIGDIEHARYFQKLRPGSEITSFQVPRWMDDFIQAEAVPQLGYRSNRLNQGGLAPKIVDPTTPGRSYELPSLWTEWLEETAVRGSGRVIK